MIRAIPLQIEGAFRDRHGRWSGCDGADLPMTNGREAAVKSRGPDIPTLISS
jgi:hypothetical protein